MKRWWLSDGTFGMLVISVVVASLWVFYFRTDMEEDKLVVTAKFTNIAGLKVGSPVNMSGFTIGRIERVSLSDDLRAEVVVALDRSIEVTDDSDLRVQTPGLFTRSHLALIPGGSFDLLENGDSFAFTQSAVDFIGLFQQIVERAEKQGREAS